MLIGRKYLEGEHRLGEDTEQGRFFSQLCPDPHRDDVPHSWAMMEPPLRAAGW